MKDENERLDKITALVQKQMVVVVAVLFIIASAIIYILVDVNVGK